jgi:hypothetical protein
MRALRTVRNTYVSQTEEGGTFAKPSPADSESAVIPPAPGNELPSPWHEWMSQSEAGDVRPAAGRGTDDTTAVVHPPTIASPPGALPLIPEARGDDASAIGRGSASRSLEESRKRDERHRPSEQGDAIYLEGAGVILLHPFLEPLFRDRGLLAGRSFRDTDARDRAVRLLGLLTFGSADVPEDELVLAKALCGCAFEEPLEPVQLDDHDIAACDALLRAVLGHWTALRSSSPEWMRQQFFLREGKLERVDEGYRLTIERRAQDVLLARLPWGCGFVALPWLADRIFVRWLD